MKKILSTFIAISLCLSAFSQAGKGVYQFLNLPIDARSVSLGGINVTVNDGDFNLAMNNPALLSRESSNMLTLNYSNYLADINYGSVGFAHYVGKDTNNIIGLGVNYFDYGKFQGYTEEDQPTTTFTAKDIAFHLMYARLLPKGFSVGAIVKPVYSVYELYSSAGMAFDIGAAYHNDTALVDVGIVLKNAGFMFDGYYSIEGKQHREPLPLNLLFGVSKKFKHAPIRLSFTMHNMQTWNLGYERSSTIEDEYDNGNVKKVNWINMFFRHTIFSAEFLLHKNFSLTASFNPRRRAEMNIPDVRTIAGFAAGAQFKIKMFRAGFSVTQYQVGALSYNFTLSTNLSEFGVR